MARLLDARLLVYLLLVVVGTGIPLMMWFDTDAQGHADRLGWLGMALRAAHSASTALLVLGTVAHFVSRLRPSMGAARSPADPPTKHGIRTGAVALAAVGFAAITGALLSQTAAAEALARFTGLDRFADAVLWTAIVHIAYATIVVLLATYFHIARWGWARVTANRLQLVAAVAVTVLVAGALWIPAPGSDAKYGGATWLAVPPVAWLWGWTLLVSVLLWVGAGRLARTSRPAAGKTEDAAQDPLDR